VRKCNGDALRERTHITTRDARARVQPAQAKDIAEHDLDAGHGSRPRHLRGSADRLVHADYQGAHRTGARKVSTALTRLTLRTCTQHTPRAEPHVHLELRRDLPQRRDAVALPPAVEPSLVDLYTRRGTARSTRTTSSTRGRGVATVLSRHSLGAATARHRHCHGNATALWAQLCHMCHMAHPTVASCVTTCCPLTSRGQWQGPPWLGGLGRRSQIRSAESRPGTVGRALPCRGLPWLGGLSSRNHIAVPRRRPPWLGERCLAEGCFGWVGRAAELTSLHLTEHRPG
jgi:hypothetical protein